jgi:hypothetical protein
LAGLAGAQQPERRYGAGDARWHNHCVASGALTGKAATPDPKDGGSEAAGRTVRTSTRLPPKPERVLVALLLALAGSLAIDASLVALGTTAFPATKGYGHFHFSDYGLLTAVGVVLASAAWVVIARLSSDPRRVLFRFAVAVTIVLWLPDIWLLIEHQPATAVAVLMCMHLGIALVTYNLLIHVAPARDVPAGDLAMQGGGEHQEKDRELGGSLSAHQVDARTFQVGQWVWVLMMIGIGLELALGIVALVAVPVHRPDGWVPEQGRAVYLIHAVLGGILTLVAMWLVTVAPRQRVVRAGIVIGLVGLALGAGGGVLAVYHPSRFAGLALMFAGTLVAFFGYLIPLIEPGSSPATG